MKLNHLDLLVSDVQRSVHFFERYFDLELQSSRASPALAILSDQHGFVLVLQRQKGEHSAYPDGFHLGFMVDEVEDVHRVLARAKEDACAVSDIIENNRGTMIYLRAPEGYTVEVSCRKVRES